LTIRLPNGSSSVVSALDGCGDTAGVQYFISRASWLFPGWVRIRSDAVTRYPRIDQRYELTIDPGGSRFVPERLD
jgi:hypothetical protein